MALSIKSPEVEELAKMTGESKTEAVRRALAEHRERLSLQQGSRERGNDSCGSSKKRYSRKPRRVNSAAA